MIKVKDITAYLESVAPLAYQESYDNAGLITGSHQTIVTGILISLDCIESVIDEAIAEGCNMIISHHPIVFSGLKKITGSNYVERTIIKAIKHDIALYAIHTNLDNVHTGVNKKICEKIGLENPKILEPTQNSLSKLTTFIPYDHIQSVVSLLHETGAGALGNYEQCSFTVNGIGSFTPKDKAKPHTGRIGQQESVEESRIEMIFPSYLQREIVVALKASHPYEEVAYFINTLSNKNQEVGSGMIGELPVALTSKDFLTILKEKMNLTSIRHTKFLKRKVKKVAVCGGAGSFLLKSAIAQKADAFVSADFKYHEFFDAEENIIIADIGHYESEVFTKDLLHEGLTKKFSKFAVRLSKVDTNPISYF